MTKPETMKKSEIRKDAASDCSPFYNSSFGFHSSFVIRPSLPSRRSAFTLIELVISSALMVIILTAAYLCLSAALAGQKLLEPRAEVVQNARVALSLLSADLRAACP